MPNEADAPDSSENETMVCTCCHHLNHPNAKYCESCGAPIGLTSALGPWEQTLAQGFAIRQAATTDRPRFILVFGIWLIFFPSSIAVALILWLTVRESEWQLADKLKMVAWLAVLILSAAVLYRSTANYFTRRRRREDNDDAK